MWRPENWIPAISFDEISRISPTLVSMMTQKERKLYEAGVDAMLKALITQDSKRGANVLYVDELADASTILHKPHRKGWLLFIPEEATGKAQTGD